MRHSMTLAVLGAAAFVIADDKLTLPPQHDNLDYLDPGLVAALGVPGYHTDEWGAGWIPQDCKTMATDANLDPNDVTVYNVWYDDCASDQWIMCRHKDAPIGWTEMIENFGKLPVLTRDYVRHVMAMPDKQSWAYNSNGNIALFNTLPFTVYIHESGHSLDLQDAYPDKPLSSSQKWLSEYAQDSAVPDPYAQSNQIENVAQNTVVASFDLNVEGGFCGIEPGCGNLFHQYATVLTEARESSTGNLIQPGGTCRLRLGNSPPVLKSGSAKRSERREAMKAMPDVSLSNSVKELPRREFHTGEACSKGVFKRNFEEVAKREAEAFQYMPDVGLSGEVEEIPSNTFHT